MVQLGLHHVQDLRVAVAAGVDDKAAQAVDELLPVEAVAVGALVLPLQHGPAVGVGGDRLAVLQPAGADVVVEMLDGVLDHLILLLLGEVVNVGADQADHPFDVLDHLLVGCHKKCLAFYVHHGIMEFLGKVSLGS